MDHESEGGQFTTRGIFALVTGCAVVAAILRFTTTSVSSFVAGFAVGLMFAVIFVVAGTAYDAVERRAQVRWARAREKEPLDAKVLGADTTAQTA
jgi:hypothetical protein